ncbi:bisphosphoglycerate mutase isoform X3 [Oncorhynchus mykiss]|uniref:Bisphosphoglycerate mutase n=2 Tax=Oncorhynchus mykiss TaxID=8022 RepID=A0A8C7P527_ONCMY|nr:bisphosphoglycerate mutase isoform X3 [Oncorhynchus mykiss]
MSKYKVFVMRHGEGAWTKENRFCSWVDQRLSEDGVKEALACGHLLKEAGYQLDVVFTSLLSRSIHTAWLLLEAMGQEWVPVVRTWRLNERHYGALIGLNRAEMALNHGEEQVKQWRRSYDLTPPPIDESHPYFLEIYNDRRYSTCDLSIEFLPKSESLKDVLERLQPYWDGTIVPEIKRGKLVLISGHGNSCRALLKHLEGISDADIVNVTLPTGTPILIELDENFRPTKPMQLLGDQKAIQAAIRKVEDQDQPGCQTPSIRNIKTMWEKGNIVGATECPKAMNKFSSSWSSTSTFLPAGLFCSVFCFILTVGQVLYGLKRSLHQRDAFNIFKKYIPVPFHSTPVSQ